LKKIVSIGLLTFLFTNGAGFYIYFYFRLQEIRREMHAEIARTSPELLKHFSLSLGDYNRVKKGDDEVKWDGKMYDIASIKFNGNQVEILALVDEDETNLLTLLSKIAQSASGDTKAPPSALMQYLSLNFTVPNLQKNSLFRIAVDIVHNTPYQEKDCNINPKVIAPPPRATA
jgi:hypothetical protein